MRARLVASLSLLIIACGGSTPTDVRPQPAQVSFVNAPTGATVGSEVSVTVHVVDANGAAVPIQLVNFVVAAGGGHVSASSALTSAAGDAKDVWTLGTAAGTQRLEARAVDQKTGNPLVLASLDVTARPGPIASVVWNDKPGNDTWIVGVPRDVRELISEVRDQYSNAVPNGYTYSITIPDPNWWDLRPPGTLVALAPDRSTAVRFVLGGYAATSPTIHSVAAPPTDP